MTAKQANGLRDAVGRQLKSHHLPYSIHVVGSDMGNIDHCIAAIMQAFQSAIDELVLPEKIDGSRLTKEEFMNTKAGVLVRARNNVIDQAQAAITEWRSKL